MTTATTTTRCTYCGLNHEAQRQYFPAGTIVSSISRVGNHPHGEIPIGSTGKVTTHCDDGRAYIFFDDYPQGGHTFHQIDDYVRIVKLPEQPRPEQAGGGATGNERGRRLGKSNTEFEINKHEFEQRYLNIECQSCDFKGTLTEGTEHGNQTGHLLQTLTKSEHAPAAPEQGETWTYAAKIDDRYHVRVKEDYNGDCVAHTDTKPRAEQICREHNQHSTLIAQRERLIKVLQLIQGFNWQLDDSPHGREIKRRAETVLITIEQEGTRRQ